MNDRLLEIRKMLGLSQDRMGKRLGVTRSSISNMETGRFSITDTMIKLICSEFGISENWLRTGEGEMFEPMDEEEELFSLFGDMIKNKPEMKKIIQSLLKMSDEEGAAFVKAIYSIYNALFPEK